MPSKAAKWTCVCGKVFIGKWALYHHIENSHSMEALRNLEQDITKDHCFYCDDKPIMKTTIRKHSKKHHLKRAIEDFIVFQCSRIS
jgi:hypothetical protein